MSTEPQAVESPPPAASGWRRGCCGRILKLAVLIVALSAVALWPGGPLRPRAASLRSFVPSDAQVVVRLDPATCLDSAFVKVTAGTTGRRGLVEWALTVAGMDELVAADDALAATALVSELVVFVRADEPYVVARLTPLAHALSVVDQVWSPPADVPLARQRDVLLFAPSTSLLKLADDTGGDAEAQSRAERPFDTAIAWGQAPGASIRLWARPSSLGAVVRDRDVSDLLGLAAVWLTPSRLETLSAELSLTDEPPTLTLRIDARPHETDTSTDRGAHAARLRAVHLAPANDTLWHAGLAGSVDQVARALLRDRVFLPRALDRLTDRLRAATMPGVAVALTHAPQVDRNDGAGESYAGASPARFVAAVRLRPGIDDRRVAADIAQRLGEALRRDVAQELTAGGRTIIRVTGPEGPALVIGRGELILFETRTHDEPLIAAQTWSDAAGPAALVADARIDFRVIETHLRERAERAMQQQLAAETGEFQEDAARSAHLGSGVIQISSTPNGHAFDITISTRAADSRDGDPAGDH